MNKFKINDIVVRIKCEHRPNHLLGTLTKVYIINRLAIRDNNDIEHGFDNIRHATKAEIKAYNKGIRNINDIKQLKLIQIY